MRRICVDFDGVLCDVHRLALALLNREFKTNFVVEDWDHWFWSYEAFGKEPFWETWDFIAEHDLRLGLPPFPDAIDTIQKLVVLGHDVDVVTGNRTPGALSIRKWLDMHGLSNLKLIHQEPGDWTWKGDLEYDVFVEDAPPFFEKVPEYPKAGERLWIVFDRPWNRKMEEDGVRVRRAFNWVDVLRLIVEWEAKRG